MLPVTQSENSANGTESGSESRMVSGCTRLSNCEARIMYMNTIDSRNAQMNSLKVVRAPGRGPRRRRIGGRHVHLGRSACAAPRGDRPAHTRARRQRAALTCAADPGGRCARRFAPATSCTRLSSRTRPPPWRRHVEREIVVGIVAVAIGQTQLHVVVLVDRRITEARDFSSPPTIRRKAGAMSSVSHA